MPAGQDAIYYLHARGTGYAAFLWAIVALFALSFASFLAHILHVIGIIQNVTRAVTFMSAF